MDLGSKGKTPRVGAHLKALDEVVLMAVSDLSCNSFCILSPRFEQCDHYFSGKIVEMLDFSSVLFFNQASSCEKL